MLEGLATRGEPGRCGQSPAYLVGGEEQFQGAHLLEDRAEFSEERTTDPGFPENR